MGPLWEATRDLHHRAEQHPVAQRMIRGETPPQEWADWLHALWQIHAALDPHLPLCARRADAFAQDLCEMLPVVGRRSTVAAVFAASLTEISLIFGAAYITVGAHRRGGRVIERAMRESGASLPHNHITFSDPQSVENLISKWRNTPGLEHGARLAFLTLHDVMDEIEGRNDGYNP